MALEVPLSTSAVTSHCLPGVISRKHALQKPQQNSLYTFLVLIFSNSQGTQSMSIQESELYYFLFIIRTVYLYKHLVKHIFQTNCFQHVSIHCCSKVTTLASNHSFAQLRKQHHTKPGSALSRLSLGIQTMGTRQGKTAYLCCRQTSSSTSWIAFVQFWIVCA